jgi:hypothetical protein
MSPGHDKRGERHGQHKEKPASHGAESSNEPSGDVLREIVRQTAESLAAPEQVDPDLRAALVEVARRYAGEPMTVDPAGAALLEAVLRRQLPALVERPTLLARTARVVATSLLADPTARLRVEHLWATLMEEVG